MKVYAVHGVYAAEALLFSLWSKRFSLSYSLNLITLLKVNKTYTCVIKQFFKQVSNLKKYMCFFSLEKKTSLIASLYSYILCKTVNIK